MFYRPTDSIKSALSPSLSPMGVVAASFELKYTYLILFGLLFSLAVFAIPVLFLVHQNYALFEELSYHPTPELLTQLEAEVLWLHWYFAGAALGVLTLCLLLALRFSGHIIRPVLRIEKHMESMGRGRYDQNPVQLHRGDEFTSLVSSYNRLARSLQSEKVEDIAALEQLLELDPSYQARGAIEGLILKKKLQIGKAPRTEANQLFVPEQNL